MMFGSLADTNTPSMSARKEIGIYIHELFTSVASMMQVYQCECPYKELQIYNACFAADKLANLVYFHSGL